MVPVSIREMGNEVVLVPVAGTVSEPEKVVPLKSRLLTGHVVGAVTLEMLSELTVIGTSKGLWTVKVRHRGTPGYKRAATAHPGEAVTVLVMVKSVPAVSWMLGRAGLVRMLVPASTRPRATAAATLAWITLLLFFRNFCTVINSPSPRGCAAKSFRSLLIAVHDAKDSHRPGGRAAEPKLHDPAFRPSYASAEASRSLALHWHFGDQLAV